jgi:outer membrane protein OmpA-like peptidoglycan-associated protein
MPVQLFFSVKKRPAAFGGQPVSTPSLKWVPGQPTDSRSAGSRLLTVVGALALLAGTSCEQAQTTETTTSETTVAKSDSVTTAAPASAMVMPDSAAAAAKADSLIAAGWGSAVDSAGGVPAVSTAKPGASAKAKFVGMRDTVGNGLASRLLGGAFNPATLRYRRDPATPLMLKLARRTTLMVGVNSSESRLYHLFSDKKVPAGTLAQPLVLDRLAFEPGQARLGAEAAQQLGNVAALLHTFPKVRLQLSGHAAPTEPQAWTLPAARAQACLAELIKRGVAPARLHTAPATPKAGDPNPQGLSIRVVAR